MKNLNQDSILAAENSPDGHDEIPSITNSDIQAVTPAVATDSKPYPVDFWDIPLTITVNAFKHKSLSDFAGNIAIGCSHACGFCYVPEVSAIKQASLLKQKGVDDPDSEWGQYVFPRKLDEKKFIASVKKADAMQPHELSADGHRAVMFCSTTDPYQVIRHPDSKKQKELNEARADMMRKALTIIRDHSTLNVRILTRSPLAKKDFDLFKSFGNRLILGVSLPSLRTDLAKLYEPKAPAPALRLKLLKEATAAGIPVYVAMAPTFPESGYDDLLATLTAVKEVNPVTVFHEPINIRAENAARIKAHAEKIGAPFKHEVFETPESWQNYALTAFSDMERAAKDAGMFDKLHLWVDKALGSKSFIKDHHNPAAYTAWRDHWWNRISEWPGADPRPNNSEIAPPNPFNPEAHRAVLDGADIEYLTTREAIVTNGLNAGLRAAEALHEIKTYKGGMLWKQEYKTFRDYCKAKWNYAKTHAYRLTECGSFMKALQEANSAPDGPQIAMPLNENQVRPIMALPAAARVEAWTEVIAEQTVDALTGAEIAERIKGRLPAKTPRAHPAPIQLEVVETPEPAPVKILTELETCLNKHPKYPEIVKFINDIRKLVAA